MAGTHLVVSVRTDEQEILRLGARHQIFDKHERCRIEPLEIIHKNNERVVGAGKYADEALEYSLKSELRVQGRQCGDRWLWSDQDHKLGDQIGQKSALTADRIEDGIAPVVDVILAAIQGLTHELLESLGESGIWNVSQSLVELA
ncbi:hypothetical protein V1281_005427 [Nitrobacteraceae bacterium AZCC 2161]